MGKTGGKHSTRNKLTMNLISKHHKSVKQNFSKYENPEPGMIPSLWAELSARASLAPVGERGGIHRVQTALLAAIPAFMLPDILDKLTRGGAI